MIKTGIYNVKQLKKLKLKTFYKKEKNISILLYNKLLHNSDFSDYEFHSEFVLNRFNVKNNLIKRTYRNRFDEFDDLIVNVVKEKIKTKLNFHDMAISDGRASIYLVRKLNKYFPEMKLIASDLDVIYLIHHYGSKSYFITNYESKIIEFTKPPFVWNYERPEGKIYFINNLLKKIYLKKLQKFLSLKILKVPQKFSLIDNEFKELINSNPNYKLSNYNFFDKPNIIVNVIRAMNVLHYGYFKKEEINEILTNIYNSLEIGGLFIEGSNENADSPVEGGIYKKTQNGFEQIITAKKQSRIIEQIKEFKFKTHNLPDKPIYIKTSVKLNKVLTFLHYGYYPEFTGLPFWLESYSPSSKYNNKSEKELINLGSALLSEEILRKNSIRQDKENILLLSGGLDSRLLLGLLVKNNVNNFKTVTYGVANSIDMLIAIDLVDYLNIEHINIELESISIDKKDLFEIIENGCKWTFLFDAFYNRQVQKLFNNDSIFWSGFLGGELAGDHLYSPINLSWKESIILFHKKQLFNNYFSINSEKIILDKIYSEKPFYENVNFSYIEQIDHFYRQTSYIYPTLVNNKFNFELPFINNEYINFILNIPPKYRYNKNLYKKILLNIFPELFRIHATESVKTNKYYYKLKLISNKIFERYHLVKPILRKNYLDYSKLIKRNPQFREFIFELIQNLSSRNIDIGLKPIELFKMVINENCEYGDILILLASLEINLQFESF